MKKVLIVYGGAQTRGGIHTYLINLFEKSRQSKDITLALVSIGNWPLTRELLEQNYEVVAIPKNPFGFFEGFRKEERTLSGFFNFSPFATKCIINSVSKIKKILCKK